MKDRNQLIRYVGFDCIPNGGRQLHFLVDTPADLPASITVTIANELFAGDGRLSFQEAAGVCRAKLWQDLEAGEKVQPRLIKLTVDDVYQFRERPRRQSYAEKHKSRMHS